MTELIRAVRLLRPDVISFGVNPEGVITEWEGPSDPPTPEEIFQEVNRPTTPEEIREGLPDLTPRQIRLALAHIGINESDIDEALSGNSLGLIEWKHATSFKRNHVLLLELVDVFELSNEQIDTLWVWASEL